MQLSKVRCGFILIDISYLYILPNKNSTLKLHTSNHQMDLSCILVVMIKYHVRDNYGFKCIIITPVEPNVKHNPPEAELIRTCLRLGILHP